MALFDTLTHCADEDPAEPGSLAHAFLTGEPLTVSATVEEANYGGHNVVIMVNGHIVGRVSVECDATLPTETHNGLCSVFNDEHSDCPGFLSVESYVSLVLSRENHNGRPSVSVRTW